MSCWCPTAGNLTSISQTVPGSHPGQPDRTVSVWSSPDRIQNFDWALYSACAILPKYEILFDYPYFLPKLDIVAFPHYAFLAMEDWGLLYYDQDRIEIAPGTDPLSFRCAFPIPPNVKCLCHLISACL